MSSISSLPLPIPIPKQPAHQAVIIPFNELSYKKEKFQPCIFCGKTIKIHTFKGKTVCIHCLRLIPAIFSSRYRKAGPVPSLSEPTEALVRLMPTENHTFWLV